MKIIFCNCRKSHSEIRKPNPGKEMTGTKQIYLYKDWAYVKQINNYGRVHYYSMPADNKSFWQKCTKEDYEQAQYYGMPAKNITISKTMNRMETAV